MPGISLILPTYNERGNIAALIRRIYSALQDVEVIVVDDDSPDRTWEVVQSLCPEHPDLRVHRRLNERGLRSAIEAGIHMATGTCVGWLDCDLSMPPELLVEMAASLQSADLVIGSRYVSDGGDDRPFLRQFSSLAINALGRWLLGTRTLDLTSGFVLCRRQVLEKQSLSGHYGEYCIALIFRCERAGFRVVEIPYRFTDRTQGESKTHESLLGFFSLGSRYVRMILRLFLERMAPRRELSVF
jgi:dolichol-phosphate mannosyltransferase